MKKHVITILILIGQFGILPVAFSQNPSPTSDLILSEVFYDASGSDDGMEWVELYNRGNSAIDLSNYSLGNGGTNYTYSKVQLSGTIAPHSFFVVGGPTSNATNYNPSFDQSVNFSPDFQNDGSTADGVALFNLPASSVNASAVPIDVVIYGSSNSNNLINTTGNSGSIDVGSAAVGKSIERTSINPNQWHIQDTPNPNTSPYQSTIPVELSAFNALLKDRKIILTWITQTETENLGFHVYRSMAEDGEFVKISPELIQGAGSSDQAHSYSYTDQDEKAGNTYYYKLADVDFNGNIAFHGPISVTVEAVKPTKYALEQSYPNPFNPETAINFSIKQADKVSLKIYNLQGQLIRSLVDADKLAGSYSVIWNGTNDQGFRVSSGTYLYTLKVNGFEETKKLTFMK